MDKLFNNCQHLIQILIITPLNKKKQYVPKEISQEKKSQHFPNAIPPREKETIGSNKHGKHIRSSFTPAQSQVIQIQDLIPIACEFHPRIIFPGCEGLS